jgi:hypothetical protein
MNSIAKIIIYVDVDDTFVRSYGSKRIPVSQVIQHIKDLWGQGAELYCWSSGGAAYAKASAFEFGIGECFSSFLPKPNVILDDQAVGEWRHLVYIHPNGDALESVGDLMSRCAISLGL